MEEVRQIGEKSSQNNQKQNITGVLLFLGGIFFQILEGDEYVIDKLYEKILQDPRHVDIVCLKAEYEVNIRLFPNWSMKTINLDENTDVLIQPIKSLLQTVTESHRILERYTQPTIIRLLTQGINPLTVTPKMTEKIILFGDVFSFSTFAEKLPVKEVVTLVNQYFMITTQAITEQGGEVIKFIGDCVMASFEANEADAAIQAVLEILQALDTLRHQVGTASPLRFLYTGIGIAYGEVIEGNIGSPLKMDYTLLGDAVNVAARMEALTRQLPYSLALSAEVKARCQQHWDFINLGEHQIKGKENLVKVYSVKNSVNYDISQNLTATDVARELEKMQLS